MTDVARYDSGEGQGRPVPGDFILTHRKALYSFMVSRGQRLRFRGPRKPYAHWSHVALISSPEGEIIEARNQGVILNHLSEYQDVEYHYVHVDLEARDREQAVSFARACVGQRYGWTTIASLAIMLATGCHFQFGFDGTEICSGLVARALERGPCIFPKAPNTMMPADLAEYFDIQPLT